MRRFVILAIAVTGLLAFGATTASAAANFKSQSFSVNNQGWLSCSFCVFWLGKVPLRLLAELRPSPVAVGRACAGSGNARSRSALRVALSVAGPQGELRRSVPARRPGLPGHARRLVQDAARGDAAQERYRR